VQSIFDGVDLVWNPGMDIGSVSAPEGFVVTPAEVHGLVGLMKFSWQIYADENNYYLSPLNSLYPGFDHNSYYARESGYRVCGTDREMFELIKAKLGESKARPIEALSGVVRDASCRNT
jgi:hypothetical protein